MSKKELKITVNGQPYEVFVKTNTLLVEVLRDQLGLTGTKRACNSSSCGACTVIMNGKTVRSCLVLAVEAGGTEIVTLEGADLRPWTGKLRKKFHEKNSFQCGFCAPGVILSAAELLEKNSRPSRHDIKEAIAGNLCRCTGYTPIIDAIEETAKGK